MSCGPNTFSFRNGTMVMVLCRYPDCRGRIHPPTASDRVFLRSWSRLASLNSVRIRTDALTIELVDEAQVRKQLKTMIGSKEPRAWELCAGQSVPVRWARGALWSIVAPFGSSGEPEVGPNPYKKLSIALFSRLLKKSLRLRNPGDKRDFLRVDGTRF